MRTELVIRFDYGSVVPWVRRLDARTLLAVGGPDGLVLRTPIDLEPEDMTHAAEFTVRAGDRVPFVLTWFPSHEDLPRAGRRRAGARRHRGVLARLDRAAAATRASTATRCARSLIVLKALTYRPTGGIVAAPTTSLPERIGGVRNWDYRYCWLRDATFTLYALMNAGFIDEARAWRDWLLRAVAGDPAKAQILYGVGGQRRIPEYELDWLPGYAGSRPGADRQRGARAVPARRVRRGDGRAPSGARARPRRRRPRLVAAAQPDRVPRRRVGPARRGHLGGARAAPPLHALEGARVGRVRPRGAGGRALGICDGPVDRWRRLRAGDPRRRSAARASTSSSNSFTQSYGSDELDASTLLIPLLGFLPADDPRVVGTIDGDPARPDARRLRRALPDAEDATTSTGCPAAKACSCRARSGSSTRSLMLERDDEARELFERLLGVRNDLGLLVGGVRPGARSACSATSRRRSRTSVSSTRRTTSRTTTARPPAAGAAEDAAGTSSARLHRARGSSASASSRNELYLSARCARTGGRDLAGRSPSVVERRARYSG